MYTTNAIENLNRIYRKVTKTRNSFPTDMALMKLLYLSTINLTEKWKTGYAKDWHLIKGQLAIEYEERRGGSVDNFLDNIFILIQDFVYTSSGLLKPKDIFILLLLYHIK